MPMPNPRSTPRARHRGPVTLGREAAREAACPPEDHARLEHEPTTIAIGGHAGPHRGAEETCRRNS